VRPTLSKRKIYNGDDFWWICGMLMLDWMENCDRASRIFLECQARISRIWCLVGPAVQKKNANFRQAIGVTESLAITLRFLATADSYHSMMYLFKVSTQSILLIIPQVCEALINAMDAYVKVCIPD
jgi:hypothetical protein